MRTAAALVKSTLVISNDGPKWRIQLLSSLKNSQIDFEDGVEFNECNSMLFSNCYTHLLLSIVKWFSICFQLWIASIDGNDYKVSWVFSVLVDEIVALSLLIFDYNHVYEKSTITFSNPTRLVHVQRKPDSGDLFTTVVRELIGEKLVTVDLHEFQGDVIRSLATF